MRLVFAICARSDNGSSPADRKRFLAQAAHRTQVMAQWGAPLPLHDAHHVQWSDGEHVTVLGWENESKVALAEPYGQTPHGMSWLLGYTGMTDAVSRIATATDLLEETADWSGCFGVLRARPDVVEVVTDMTGSSPFYMVETPTVRILSNRATHAHLVAQSEIQDSEDPLPRYDPLGVRGMGSGGYVLSNRTMFDGVRVVDAHSRIQMTPSGFDLTAGQYDDSPIEIQDQRAWGSLVDDVAQALIRAFDPLPVKRLRVGITGGRDSRMLAAAMSNRSDLDVRLFTSGHPETADVRVGSLVASTLGFPHDVSVAGGLITPDKFEFEPFLTRIVRNLDVHDAMTSAWDDCHPYRPYRVNAAISGVGGEILRGGRNVPDADVASPERAQSALRVSMLSGHYFNAHIDRAAEAVAQPLLDLAATDPYVALDRFYFEHRNRRWVSSRRTAGRLSTGAYDPLLDNQFIKLTRRVTPQVRWQEHLAFDLIAALAPSIRDLPLQGSRWRFERLGPSAHTSADVQATWDQRHAIEGKTIDARTTWKRLPTPELQYEMKTFLLDRLDSSVSDVFDLRQTAKRISADKLDARKMWHVATALVAVQTPWYKTTFPPSRNI